MNFNSPILEAMWRNSRHGVRPSAPVRLPPTRPLNKAALVGSGRFARWHVPETIEREPESWLLTYLDLITLLVAMLVVLLAISRLGVYDGKRPNQAPTPVALTGSLRILPAEGTTDSTHAAARWLDLSFPPLEPQPTVLPSASFTEDTPSTHRDSLPAPATTVPVAATPDTAAQTSPPSIDELGLDELRDSVDVVINSQSISFRINNELLFPSGEAKLHAAGLAVLKRLAVVLNRTDYPISVEGHSDNVPIKTRHFPSNWDLSTSRATSVLRGLQRKGVRASRLRAVGYADTRPIASNNTPEGRTANRRVELIMEITPSSKTKATTPQQSEPAEPTEPA
jgi:chemotaxis protein MotB